MILQECSEKGRNRVNQGGWGKCNKISYSVWSETSEAKLEVGLCFQLVLLMPQKVQALIQDCEILQNSQLLFFHGIFGIDDWDYMKPTL